MKLYWRRDVNKTLSSILEVVLRQVRVLVPQSRDLQKRELAIPFSFWSVFVTNFIWPYLYQFFDNSHSLNGYEKPLCHKLHSVISPSILRQFPRSQSQLKALKKTFRSMPVTSRGDQYWPRY